MGKTCQSENEVVSAALDLCARVAGTDPDVPVLTCVRLEGKGGRLKLEANDGRSWAEISVPCMGELPPMLVPLKRLKDLAATAGKRVKGVAPVITLSPVNGRASLEVSLSGRTFELEGLAPDDYTAPPDLGEDVVNVLYPATGELRGALEYALPAVTEDEKKLAIRGVMLLRDFVAGTDGARIHFTSGFPVVPHSGWCTFPLEASEALARALKVGQPAEVEAEISTPLHAARFIFTGRAGMQVVISAKLPETEPPDFTTLIPGKGTEGLIVMDTQPLAAAFALAKKLARESLRCVLATTGPDELQVHTTEHDGSKCTERLKAAVQSAGPLRSMLNPDFALSALATMGPQVTIRTLGGKEALYVTGEHPRRMAIVMPAREAGEGDEVAAA